MRESRPAARIGATALLAMTAAGCTPAPAAAPDEQRWAEVKEEIRTRFPDVRLITVEEIDRARRDGSLGAALLVDVRSPEEFAVSRVPGATNAPLGDTLLQVLADVPRDRRIVVYCSVGYRSAMAAQELEKAGFRDVVNLEGSIFEWANRGLALEGGDKVHPYDASWGELLRSELRAPLD